MSFHYQLESGDGALVLESVYGDYLLERIIGSARVQAVQAGFYAGIWRDIGDIFDIADPGDFSDSTVSLVPVGNPDYPLYGWMLQVVPAAPLVEYSLSGNGASTNVTGTYSTNSQGVRNLSIPRHVA